LQDRLDDGDGDRGTMTWGVEVESPVRLLARVVAFWLARTLSTLAW
jgi:hypothetical protein